MVSKKISLLGLLICMTILPSIAFTDENGRTSSQFILNYHTGEVANVSIDSPEEIENVVKTLSCNLVYSNDDTGAMVEWTFDNALFHNIVGWPIPNEVYAEDNCYYWLDRSGNEYSQYYKEYPKPWYSEPAWDSILLPGTLDNYKLHEGKSLYDVEISLMEHDVCDIPSVKLIRSFTEPCDKPSSISSDTNDFLPHSLIFIYEDHHNYDNQKFYVVCYHGQYDPDSFSLKAVTKIKYHVSNATFIPPKYIIDDNSTSLNFEETAFGNDYIYDMMGRRIREPQPGQLYIQDGKKHIGK